MLRRTLLLLTAEAGLAACAGPAPPPPPSYTAAPGPSSLLPAPVVPARPAPGWRVALLLPLTGPNAALAQALVNAAQLGLDGPGSPPLDVLDTQGTAAGAEAAARRAINGQAGTGRAGLILGPLTNAETGAAALVAREADVPMLAFTSDPAQAQPGVWTLGITPGQQVRRLVAAAQADGQRHFAALLPMTPLGDAMASALADSLPPDAPPLIRRYGASFAEINAAARDLSDYASRRGPLDAQIAQAKADQTPDGRRKLADLMKQEVPPPPFDALLLAAVGEPLDEILSLLPYYDIGPPQVHLLGPALWDGEARRLRAVAGARYAAPDPALASTFFNLYATKYGAPPPRLADFGYDAGAIARVTALGGGFTLESLTRKDGFAGVDGVLGLLPDGHVRRGLAIFEIDGAGSHIVSPAPTTLAAPGV